MATHEFLEHTGETMIRIRADSLESLLTEAAVALGEVEREGIPEAGAVTVRRLILDAPDQAALLVDWLNELIFLSETESVVPAAARVRLAGPGRLEAEVDLIRLERRPALVKAATHHSLRLEQRSDGWVAEVILDV